MEKFEKAFQEFKNLHGTPTKIILNIHYKRKIIGVYPRYYNMKLQTIYGIPFEVDIEMKENFKFIKK